MQRSSVVSVPAWHESRLLFPLLGKAHSRDIRPLVAYLPRDHRDLLPLAQLCNFFLLCLRQVYEGISSQRSAPTQLWWRETSAEPVEKDSPKVLRVKPQVFKAGLDPVVADPRALGSKGIYGCADPGRQHSTLHVSNVCQRPLLPSITRSETEKGLSKQARR